MMAEVIIVSSVIMATLVGLYSIFNKMYISYNERSYYYNVDSVYALRSIYKKLIDDGKFVDLISGTISSTPYFDDFDLDESNDSYNVSKEFYDKLNETYNINKIIFVKYDKNSIEELKNNSSSYTNGMQDYISYLYTSLDFNDSFSYMFIIELKDGDYYYYGNYRIR
jgi:hypothetical protein